MPEAVAEQLGTAGNGGIAHHGGQNPPGQVPVRAVLERALEGELSAHLGYAKHDIAGNNSGISRNGSAGKTAQIGIGPVHLSVPRDRSGTFEPVLVPKRAGRISGGLDDMIISLYAAARFWGGVMAGLRNRGVRDT